jgi:hypothetical protein
MNIETLCQAIYAQTREFEETLRPTIGNQRCGFKILYGPPVSHAPILFLSYQPGGDASHSEQGQHERWPSVCEYATKSWMLARNMQSMFGKEILLKCTGLNAIFFRAPSEAAYRSVPKHVRDLMERFCLLQARKLIDALQPHSIVAIGFKTLDLFGSTRAYLTSANGRTLMKAGNIGNHQTVATMHLSSAQISKEDRKLIAEHVLAWAHRASKPDCYAARQFH